LEARRRLAAGLGPAAGVRPARPADAEARERFLAIERVARLPAAEQARVVPILYRDYAHCYPFKIMVSMSFPPSDILDRKSRRGSGGNTEKWAEQIADAASKMTAEQIADKLGSPDWLSIAAYARAIWVLKANAAVVEPLIKADLKSGRDAQVTRAVSAIRAMKLKKYNAQMLAIFLAGGEASESARRGIFSDDPAVVQALLARAEADPNFLDKCAGMLQLAQWHKPAEPVLLKLLNSPDAKVRYDAADAVYDCIDANLAPTAKRFAKEAKPEYRVVGAHLASNLPAGAFATVRNDLLALLSDSDARVQDEALRAFAMQKDLATCQVILDAIKAEHPGPGNVMQAMSALTGGTFGYDMHNWGPGTPTNQRAIGKFEAWMESHGVAVTRTFKLGPEDAPLGTIAAANPAAAPSQTEIANLIKQLGSERFTDRQAAQQALVEIGLPALDALIAATSDNTAERAERAKAALSQLEWGDPNEGLRVGLTPLRSAWKPGQTPELRLIVRNGGKRAVEYSNAVMLYCQVQVDGLWHSWAKPFDLGLPIGMLAPGKEYTLKLCLTDDWGTPPGNAPGAAARDTKRLRLSPGRHLVRVSFTGYPELGNREGGISCESNPVQVEIEGRPAATQPATQPGEGSRENGGGKWSWIGPAREAPEAANWRAALEKAEKYALGEPRQQEALRLYQAVLDAGPPREIALHVKVIMGARLTILYNPDLGEQSLDAEALRWCQRIIEDFKDWPNHHDLMVAKIHLGDLYYIRNDREGMGKATRLYWDVIEVPEDEIVFDDPKKANLNLDKIAVAKSSVGRQLDAKGRFLTEPTEEMNMEYREVLLSRRRESTQLLRLAAIRALAYKQGVRGDTQKTRQRLLELKQRRPDDKLYQETLDAILRGFPANAEKTAPGQGQGATSRKLLASSAPDGASTHPGAIVQPVPAGPGKQGVPQTQPGGAIPPLEEES
jgi:hypothetical protein